MIEGMISKDDQLSESELEEKLGELISKGHSLSLVISLKKSDYGLILCNTEAIGSFCLNNLIPFPKLLWC